MMASHSIQSQVKAKTIENLTRPYCTGIAVGTCAYCFVAALVNFATTTSYHGISLHFLLAGIITIPLFASAFAALIMLPASYLAYRINCALGTESVGASCMGGMLSVAITMTAFFLVSTLTSKVNTEAEFEPAIGASFILMFYVAPLLGGAVGGYAAHLAGEKNVG